MACFAFVLLFSTQGLRAQITLSYNYPQITSVGDTIWHTFPPPDSAYLHDHIIIKFRDGWLNKDSLCYDCDGIVSPRTKGKGASPQDDPDYFPICKETLMAQQFSLNIILDPIAQTILMENGGVYLTRITAANPCTDTISVSRRPDTIPMDHYNWMELHFNNTTSVVSTLIAFALARPLSIQIAEPDFIGHMTRNPRDSEYAAVPTHQKGLQLIGMPSAWDLAVGLSSTKVAIIDMGLDYMRCELGGGMIPNTKVVGGWDFNSNTMSGIRFNAEHGTAVGSIAGAFTNNDNCGTHPIDLTPLGMAGVGGGWGTAGGDISLGTGVSLLGYQIFMEPTVDTIPLSWAVSAILDASAQSPNGPYGYGAHVLNNSWISIWYSASLRAAVAEAFREDVSFVAASGNYGHVPAAFYPLYPTDIDPKKDVISVGAANYQKIREPYSSFNTYTDIIAPGGAGGPGGGPDQISRVQDTDCDGCFSYFNGTSAAAPYVSGVLGIMRGFFPQISGTIPYPEDWEGMLESSAEDIDSTYGPDPSPGLTYLAGYDTLTGWGLLRADSIMHMINPNQPHPYDIYHYFLDSSECSFGSWDTSKKALDLEEDGYPKSLTTGRYMVKRRTVTGTFSYDSTIDTTKPVYVWAIGDSIGGWSLASPNSQELYDVIDSGQGGNGLRSGIRHQYSRSVTAHTYQYDVWDSSGAHHIGQFPNDTLIGVSFTVFAANKAVHFFDGVQRNETIGTDGLLVWPSIMDKSANVHSDSHRGMSKFVITNMLGIDVLQMELPPETSDFKFVTSTIPDGFYLCRLISESGTQMAKIIVRH